MLGLADVKWEEKEEEQQEQFKPQDMKQRTLSDFMGQGATS